MSFHTQSDQDSSKTSIKKHKDKTTTQSKCDWFLKQFSKFYGVLNFPPRNIKVSNFTSHTTFVPLN